MREHRRTCSLCEALCGIVVEYEDDGTIQRIRGNDNDPLSRGHVCPKAMALKELHEDGDRLRAPVVRVNGEWREISWEEAVTTAAKRLHETQESYGRDAVATYSGNPNAHHYRNLLANSLFRQALRTKNKYSATSVDQLPHHFAALQMFGHQLVLPIPDLERTDLLYILGGNPMVSNGSIMTAPDFKHRAREIQRRGGKIVVVDPRRTETANIADEHHFIRPGTDTFLLLALLQHIFESGLVRGGRWQAFTNGLDALERATRAFTPELAEARTGVSAATIRSMAETFANTDRAAFYGRIGVTTQEFGGLNAWLIYALNIVTGHFDSPGGVMFTSPAVDVVGLSSKLDQAGSYDRWRSRVKGYPEFGGELPSTTLADEILTAGDGQVRAVITIAGNPVLSIPGGDRLGEALGKLDFMVSLDPYINETTRHADIIIPPPSPLERDHFGLVFHALGVRNTVKYSEPLFDAPAATRDEWRTLLALSQKLLAHRGAREKPAMQGLLAILQRSGPKVLLDLLLRSGRYGSLAGIFTGSGVSLKKLIENPDGFDLGPLEPRCPDILQTADSKVQLSPDLLVDDLQRLRAGSDHRSPFVLIGRRQLRSNNSWLHNCEHMVRGKPRCTLLIHPADADELGVSDGDVVRVTSAQGDVSVPAEVSDEIMPGVVSIPHGWGHDDDKIRLATAREHSGVSVNDVVDATVLDSLTGTAALNAIPVELSVPDQLEADLRQA